MTTAGTKVLRHFLQPDTLHPFANYASICMQGCGALLCDSHNYIKHIKACRRV